MARANRRCRSQTDAEHRRNADQNDGSNDGCVAGANKITKPDDRLTIGDVVQAKVLVRLRPGRHLAKRRGFPKGDNEPPTVLDAICATVAEILGRHDDFLGQGWEAALTSDYGA